MWNQKPIFRFEIDKFSEKEIDTGIASPVYVSDGCEWFLNVWPKGHRLIGNHLSVYLYVANEKSMGTGWRRTASFYHVALNQSGKELYRSPVDLNRVFGAETPRYPFQRTVHLPKFSQKGFLENDKLIIEVYIKVVEAFDGEGGDVTKKKETVDINGFQVLASQVIPVRKIFAEHPHIALDFKSKNQVVKTEYMNVLLGLIDTLNKPLHSLLEIEISKARSDLRELMDVGFKLEWLKTKLGEGSLESKKSDDADESRVQQLEWIKTQLGEGFFDSKKSDDADESRVQQLEERVKNLELMDIGSLKSSVKHLELIVSDLKAELDKEKAKSSDCGFLLVN